MKVPVEVFTADGRLHGAPLHLPLLQMGWQRKSAQDTCIPIMGHQTMGHLQGSFHQKSSRCLACARR